MFVEVKRSDLLVWLLALALAVLLAVPGSADSELRAFDATSASTTDATAEVGSAGDDDSDSDDEAALANSVQTAAGTASTGPLSKLSVHGFLTQAFARANFVTIPTLTLPDGSEVPLGPSPSQFEATLGIPDGDWTSNYRFVALQFRYDISEKDIFVLQLSSRTLGFSQIQDFEDEIELDWAFYERRLTPDTSLKIGRVQIPFGIYNEVRDVGTVLPFYRPAFVFYKEGSFTSETVDGLLLSHTSFSDSEWSLESNAYLGEWESIQINPTAPESSGIVPEDDGYGLQFWLNTPLSDARIGAGLISFEEEEGLETLLALERRDIYHASLDAPIGRFTLQAEWLQEKTDLSLVGLPLTVNHSEWYVLAGVRITDSFHIWGQLESADLSWECPCLVESFGLTQREDIGLSINYFFTPSLVVKAEYHTVDEQVFTFLPSDFTNPFAPLVGLVADAPDGNYTIVALSVSF